MAVTNSEDVIGIRYTIQTKQNQQQFYPHLCLYKKSFNAFIYKLLQLDRWISVI